MSMSTTLSAEELVDAMVAELVARMGRDPRVDEPGPEEVLIEAAAVGVSALFELLATRGAGVEGMTPAALEECLLDHVPRAVSAPPEVIAMVPAGLREAFSWLAEKGIVEQRRAHELVAMATALEASCQAASVDEGRWGPAKTLVMAMLAAGTNMSDPAEIQRFVDGESARRGRRTRTVGSHRGGRPPTRRR